ncbi:MAG: ACP S-malonyltransferase [Niameybacter sp.]|uniref:ACP S-malonyltransferase n=1 Tax=Niameybacter sp. TaxID=2033640 RepID=UPI002FC9D973
MKIAFLFSGQGAQFAGMGKNLYENYSESQETFDKASNVLDWDVKEVCFEDTNGLINQTRYTQAALFTTSIAAFNAAKAQGIVPDAVLGFSLGEYSALVASGVLSFEEALKLVDKRAHYMDECAKEKDGGMAAVIGLQLALIEEVCELICAEGLELVVANDNCPGQVVISGEKAAIEKATPLLKEKGARRVMPLNVSGAFHSPLMDKAADNLKEELKSFNFKEVTTPIVSNVTADYMNTEEAICNIPLQIVTGVRFRESIEKLINEGFDTFIEIGVKKTLCNFVSKISSDVTVLNIEDETSLQNTMSVLGGKQC